MNTIDVIKVLNSKLFHDLGNAITNLSLLEELESGSGVVKDMVSRFKLLRQALVEVDSEMTPSSCHEMLVEYFSNKKLDIQQFSSEVQFTADQYQLIINLVMSIVTSISYSGNIILNFKVDGIEIKANAKGVTDFSILQILNGEIIELNTKNIQAYFVTLLAKNIQAKIKCSHHDNDIKVDVVLGKHYING